MISHGKNVKVFCANANRPSDPNITNLFDELLKK